MGGEEGPLGPPQEELFHVIYRVILIGTSTGSYELTIQGTTETETFLTESYSGTIENGETHETTVTIPRGVGELEISAPEEIPSVPSPAAFEVSNLSVVPAEVEAGEEVKVSVDVANVGELAGDHTLSLRVDGVVEFSPTITLTGGETRKVVFPVVRDVAGTYGVEIGGMPSSFTVAQPAEEGAPAEEGVQILLILIPVIGVVVVVLVLLYFRWYKKG